MGAHGTINCPKEFEFDVLNIILSDAAQNIAKNVRAFAIDPEILQFTKPISPRILHPKSRKF